MVGKTAVCGLNTSSVWTEFGIRQQHPKRGNSIELKLFLFVLAYSIAALYHTT